MTESALAAVGHRLRGADLAPIAGALPAAIALIARVCPQVRPEVLADAMARSAAVRGKGPDDAGAPVERSGEI